MTTQERNRRKLQSAVDTSRKHNIVRATETYQQTKQRLMRELFRDADGYEAGDINPNEPVAL